MTEKHSKILIVDDDPNNITTMAGVLPDDYQLIVATNGLEALETISSEQPDLVLLDVTMPGMDGYEVCRQLKENPVTCEIPVIFLTALNEAEDEQKGLELGAVDYMIKPVNPAILRTRVKTHLALYYQTQTLEQQTKILEQQTRALEQQTRTLEQQVAERTTDLVETRRQIILRLSRAAEYRDNDTGNHVIRMSHYARLIAQAGGQDEKFVELLYNAAPMHDVGKIGIPDNILLKPGKLDSAEWTTMCQHPAIGAKIIGQHQDDLLQMAYVVALAHHEKWDGSGYPNQLKGEEIPLAARIVAISDVFDALTSDRPYKKAWSIEDAVRVIEEGSGQHFDPHWIPPFRAALPEIVRIKEEFHE
ncbi:putative cyclic di-GMP phosphodiesterase VC_1348 [Gammaproteobacteria bacterium]